MSPLLGIHHVTAVCGSAQQNLDFYTQTLGLRLVKLTVNFDDPTAYHLYYGDAVGSPGTIITFFAYPQGRHGARGAGSFNSISLAVPDGSLDYWFERLSARDPEWYVNNHGERSVVFEDPDGMRLAMVEHAPLTRRPWTEVVPSEFAITGILGVQIGARMDHTRQFFTGVLGLPMLLECSLQSGQTKTRLSVGSQFVDVMPTTLRTTGGRGTIHHTAFRTRDKMTQTEWLQILKEAKISLSDVKDRNYFHSIYFREPGAALCEIATDTPGFAIDEAPDSLGTRLMIPAQYRDQADSIVAQLPPLRRVDVNVV